MRVCVTGAGGFIGANLVARLKSQGHWVRGLDIQRPAHRAHLFGQADEFLTVDLSREMTGRLDGIDHVYHLAADHGGAGYFYSDADYKAACANLIIDENVRRAAIINGVGRLFFASSACTYPTGLQHRNARALRESDLGNGEGEQLYGAAKRMSTLLFEGARDHGLDCRSGIFHTIYGPGQDYREPRAKFPTAICRKIIENPERVEVWGDGTQVRTFLFIDDALDRIQTVMRESYEGPVNIGSPERATVLECCQWAATAAGVSPEWVWIDGPTGVLHRRADNGEWNRRYGITPLLSAREGFAITYDWLRGQIGAQTSC